jgi:hypothetical protein
MLASTPAAVVAACDGGGVGRDERGAGVERPLERAVGTRLACDEVPPVPVPSPRTGALEVHAAGTSSRARSVLVARRIRPSSRTGVVPPD